MDLAAKYSELVKEGATRGKLAACRDGGQEVGAWALLPIYAPLEAVEAALFADVPALTQHLAFAAASAQATQPNSTQTNAMARARGLHLLLCAACTRGQVCSMPYLPCTAAFNRLRKPPEQAVTLRAITLMLGSKWCTGGNMRTYILW
jgi:hypothetical protein